MFSSPALSHESLQLALDLASYDGHFSDRYPILDFQYLVSIGVCVKLSVCGEGGGHMCYGIEYDFTQTCA